MTGQLFTQAVQITWMPTPRTFSDGYSPRATILTPDDTPMILHNGSLGHMYGTNNGATGIPIRLVPTFQRVPTSVAGPPAIRTIPHYELSVITKLKGAINL